VGLPPDLLNELEDMPGQLEMALRQVPVDRLAWRPQSWGGCPSETFSALEQVCHLRDIERDGYHVRIRRMLEEPDPSLDSLDSYQIARERRYESEDLQVALDAFREARAATVRQLRTVSDVQLDRTGEFAEYGRLSLRGLVHYLRSHDQQHLAGLQWLAGKSASPD
jgi:DinB family protein